MAVITFWNARKEETGKTMSVAAIATYLAIEHNYKILVMSTDYKDDTLETCFWEPNKSQDFISAIKKENSNLNEGFEGLARVVTSNRTTPEIITNYTKVVFKESRLEILGTIKHDYNEYERLRPTYLQIIKAANKYYDYVLVDLDKNIDNETTKGILENSNLIVVSLVQKLKTIDIYMKLRQEDELLKKDNVVAMIGKYDKNSKYSSKNVARYIGEKKEIYTIPYCTLFFESCNEGKLPDFFIKYRNVTETDENGVFIREIKNVAAGLIYKLQELQAKM